MSLGLEGVAGFALAALAMPSAIVLGTAYARTSDRRLLIGAAAFAIFAAKGLLVGFLESAERVVPELVELTADMTGLALFLLALLWPKASHGQ